MITQLDERKIICFSHHFLNGILYKICFRRGEKSESYKRILEFLIGDEIFIIYVRSGTCFPQGKRAKCPVNQLNGVPKLIIL